MFAVLTDYSFVQMAIFCVAIAGIAALVWIGLKAMKVEPPAWVMQALWVVVIVAVIIFLIKVVASLL